MRPWRHSVLILGLILIIRIPPVEYGLGKAVGVRLDGQLANRDDVQGYALRQPEEGGGRCTFLLD